MKNDILENKDRMKDNPFIVPEGYFGEMAARASSVKKRRSVNFVPYVSIAAAAVLLTAGIWTWSALKGGSIPDLTADSSTFQMSDEEIIAYLIYSGAEVEDIELDEY